MSLQSLVKANTKYNLWKKCMEASIQAKTQEIQAVNSALDLDELRQLDYKSAKAIFDTIQGNLPDTEQREKIIAVLYELWEKSVRY